jgi:trehalose 6-phosphate synthase
MNLVAKEFVACQAAGSAGGVLVLSEFAGAAEELREALPCNPFDLEGLAGTIELALELEDDDRAARIERLARRVSSHDVAWWLESELALLERGVERVEPAGLRQAISTGTP